MFLLFIYICIVVRYWVEDPINQLYQPYFIDSPKPGPEFSKSYVVVFFFVFVQWFEIRGKS